jgi:hypothetical protein
MTWRSLGDSNPCFRRERVNTRTSAYLSKQQPVCILSILLAATVRCGTLNFAYGYSPKTPHTFRSHRPGREPRNTDRPAPPANPLRAVLAGLGKGVCTGLPPPRQGRHVARSSAAR